MRPAMLPASLLLPLALLVPRPAAAESGDEEEGVVLGDVVGTISGLAIPSSGPLVHPAVESRNGRFDVSPLRGLSLDLEACLNGGCIRASEGDEVVLRRGDAGPVRVRLHLDCAELDDVRAIASLSRVVLLRAKQLTTHCPREPQDAYCEFRYWQEETRWDDDLVADFFPRMADTAWPDPEGRVDEAELTLEIPADVAPGEYDLVAALPKELVDQYPCGEVRNHQWVESDPLRIRLVDDESHVRWKTALVALRESVAAGDESGLRLAIDDLKWIAADAPPGVLPLGGPEAEQLADEALARLDDPDLAEPLREAAKLFLR